MRDVSFFFFFWLIPWGFHLILCLHACPGCHPPHPHSIGDEATQVDTVEGATTPPTGGLTLCRRAEARGQSHTIDTDSAAKKPN